MTQLWIVGCLLLSVVAVGAPIRSDKEWAIYPQVDPADWPLLVGPVNLVAGLPPAAEPAPNDRHTGGDLGALTDGVLAGVQGRMWTDKRAVGWAYQQYARITCDLGQSRPIGQVLMRLQVIDANNTLPRTISVSLSDDGEAFVPVRNLSAQSHPEDDPARTYSPLPADYPGIYAVVLNLGYQARYLRLDFALHGTMIADELAVTPAEGAVRLLPAMPPGEREYLDNVFDRRDQFRRMIAPGNLILGKRLRYTPAPTQYLNIDDDDPLQLTDGKLGERTDERIWFERGCVGWQGPPLVTIFADLEAVEPVDSVVVRLLGGAEQNALEFPEEIRVLLSEDGEDYYQVASRHKRGMDDLSDEAYELPEQTLAWVHNFRVPVGLKARYVALQMLHQKQFFVSDEMAVVKGADDLPVFEPDPGRRMEIVTEGVAFTPVWRTVPVCQNLPLRARLLAQDAREGAEYGKPCKLVLDLPETLKLVRPESTPADVEHEGRPFRRYVVDWHGLGTEICLQSLLPPGQTDVLYTYGDNGSGPANERRLRWESLVIPPARVPKRLHVSLSWAEAPSLDKVWPDYLGAQRHLGFNAVGMQPCYWRESSVAGYREFIERARQAGLQIIQIESPAGAIASDRQQQETRSVLPGDRYGSVCPSYRGQFYQKEHESFARHAVWIEPDMIFYDIEAYWHGAQEAPQCQRCLQRSEAGGFTDWDQFRAAMGREIHVDMRSAIDKALAEAGIQRQVQYGSYRTQPTTPLNDGLFAFGNLYPDMLQMAMPSLYVAGSGMAVARGVATNRAAMQTNDIIPWLSTGCYGEYDPAHTRDMLLEVFANGSRGVTYYWYGYFDAAHFRYHAEAISIIAPIEDLFMDGRPLEGIECSDARVKACGMGMGAEMAVLVSNYQGVPAGTEVTVEAGAPPSTPVWDLHARQRAGAVAPDGAFTVKLDNANAHMYYIGKEYAEAIP
jgi:hypothetical protein